MALRVQTGAGAFTGVARAVELGSVAQFMFLTGRSNLSEKHLKGLELSADHYGPLDSALLLRLL